jgi:hypothetical protein
MWEWAAKTRYTTLLGETAERLGVKLDLRDQPIYSLNEAESWIQDARSNGSDGLILLLLDRQRHAWPTAGLAAESGIRTVIFSPLGSSFTTNTIHLAEKPGTVIYSTDDFSQPAYGMKMLAAAAKMKRCRCVVLEGDEQRASSIPDLEAVATHILVQYLLDRPGFQQDPVAVWCRSVSSLMASRMSCPFQVSISCSSMEHTRSNSVTSVNCAE